MKRKTKRKALTELPWDDEHKFEKAFQEYLGQLSTTFDGDGNLRDDAPSSRELPDPTIVATLKRLYKEYPNASDHEIFNRICADDKLRDSFFDALMRSDPSVRDSQWATTHETTKSATTSRGCTASGKRNAVPSL
jgi:hypothetical protein